MVGELVTGYGRLLSHARGQALLIVPPLLHVWPVEAYKREGLPLVCMSIPNVSLLSLTTVLIWLPSS